MPEGAPILAVITGERGQREIVRPLAAVGRSCTVLDWDEIRLQPGSPYLRFVSELWRLVRGQRGGVIFTDMNSLFLAAIVCFGKLTGARLVLRLRGDPFAEARDQLGFHWRQRQWPQWGRAFIAWLLDPALFAFIDRFVPVSHWIVRRLGIEPRSSVVRIPVLLEQFPPRTHQATVPLRLLAVTNFNYPQKVAAMGRFLEHYSAFLSDQGMHVTVAGAGIAWEEFRARHSVGVDYPGFVVDVAGLYATHDVFVHFSDLDAFPYVVLEAQASGLPVIVNRDCGMLEQIDHDRTGLIVDLNDCPAVETHLRRLAAEPSYRRQLGEAARRHVAETYSLEAIGRALTTSGILEI